MLLLSGLGVSSSRGKTRLTFWLSGVKSRTTSLRECGRRRYRYRLNVVWWSSDRLNLVAVALGFELDDWCVDLTFFGPFVSVAESASCQESKIHEQEEYEYCAVCTI